MPSVLTVTAPSRLRRRRTLSDLTQDSRVRATASLPRQKVARRRNATRLRSLPSGTMLHIGCGFTKIRDWVNIDYHPNSAAEILVDLRSGLPLPSKVVRFAYSEHVIEHFDRETSLRWLTDLCAGMESGGIVRIATPDLDFIIERYQSDWRNQEWLRLPDYQHVDSPAKMINMALRAWGHLFVYNGDELSRLLVEAGFSDPKRYDYGQSDSPELRGLEQRPDSMLIVEARKA